MSDGLIAPAESARPSQPPSADDQLAQICGDVAHIVKRASGRGPGKTTAHWAGRNMLVVLLEDWQTDADRTLLAAGRTSDLYRRRRLLQSLIEDELVQAVQQIVSQRVETTLSASRLDPDLSAEIFLLGSSAPEPDQDAHRPIDELTG